MPISCGKLSMNTCTCHDADMLTAAQLFGTTGHPSPIRVHWALSKQAMVGFQFLHPVFLVMPCKWVSHTAGAGLLPESVAVSAPATLRRTTTSPSKHLRPPGAAGVVLSCAPC